MAELKGYWVPRLLALVLCLVGIPLGLGLQGFLQDVPVVAGEPAPRTVIAPERVQVADPEETERLRRQAEAEVEPVVQEDLEALTAIVQRVQDAFATAQAAREPGPDGTIPSDS